jgi:hypothetical protein
VLQSTPIQPPMHVVQLEAGSKFPEQVAHEVAGSQWFVQVQTALETEILQAPPFWQGLGEHGSSRQFGYVPMVPGAHVLHVAPSKYWSQIHASAASLHEP